MIDMNVVYELIAEAKERNCKASQLFGLSYYATDHYDHTSVRVLKRVQLAKCTATNSKGVMQ